jgi:phosphomannomutase
MRDLMIFKAYDIRGIVPEQLDEGAAYAIGRATAHHFEADEIAVGRDARIHSPELAEALINGIRDEGVDVVDLGLISTPMLYYAVDHLDVGGGVMVTASHNPGEYNGFKLCREHAIPVGEDSGLKEIEALTKTRGDRPQVSPRGALRIEAVLDGYLDHILAVASGRPKLKVAIDCGNGMAGRALVPLLERLPLDVEPLYFEPDGSFPNHEADPLKRENLQPVIDAVLRTGADLGVAFDGDGDRAAFIDETGEPISSDLTTALLGRYQLKRSPRGRILYDLRSSRVVAEEIQRGGGRPEMCRVGHSFVKAQMRATGAVFAGELSGHFYFRFSKTLIADDATAAFVAMLDVLADNKEPLSKIVQPLRRYSASGEINRRVRDVGHVLRTIESEHPDAGEVSKLDGLLVRYPDWWFNLRPSNTEPVLRLNLEADTPERMAEERDRLLERVAELGV